MTAPDISAAAGLPGADPDPAAQDSAATADDTPEARAAIRRRRRSTLDRKSTV